MSRDEVLNKLAAGEITAEDASKWLDENSKVSRPFTMKVSEKGCVQFRGVPGANVQFGLSLRVESLEHLYTNEKEIREFVEKNRAEIDKRSAESKVTKAAEKEAAEKAEKVAA